MSLEQKIKLLEEMGYSRSAIEEILLAEEMLEEGFFDDEN